mmetsp:Transcript_42578/g.85223  ORF Transcript_42578/g.85223 Transcript_42578/m.85223 type:complete len:362 (+) Transcript_42578:35-1120(+)
MVNSALALVVLVCVAHGAHAVSADQWTEGTRRSSGTDEQHLHPEPLIDGNHGSRRQSEESDYNFTLRIFLAVCPLFVFASLSFAVFQHHKEHLEKRERWCKQSRLNTQKTYLGLIKELYSSCPRPDASMLLPSGRWSGSLGASGDSTVYNLTFNRDGTLHGTREDMSGVFLLCGCYDVAEREAEWAEYRITASECGGAEKIGHCNPVSRHVLPAPHRWETTRAYNHLGDKELPECAGYLSLVLPSEDTDASEMAACDFGIEGVVWSCSGEQRTLKLRAEACERVVAVVSVGETGVKIARQLRRRARTQSKQEGGAAMAPLVSVSVPGDAWGRGGGHAALDAGRHRTPAQPQTDFNQRRASV